MRSVRWSAGLLGEVSWRGPFFGTAVLMAIGLIAILVLLQAPTDRPEPIKLSATLTAIKNRSLLTLGLVALFYNFGFFVLLAYSPFPLEAAAASMGMADFGAIQLGLVFFGWGICLALTSVFVAQRMAHRFGRRRTIYLALGSLAVIELIMAVGVHQFVLVTAGVIVGGLFLGVMNTVMTEAVMEATDLPRSVASSTYSGVRFLGGAVAPAVAGPISESLGAGMPYVFGAGAFVVAVIVLTIGRRSIAHIDDEEPLTAAAEAELLTAADA